MPAARNFQFTAHLSPDLAKRLNVCARYTGKAADTIVSDLVAACMEDLHDVLEDGAESVESLLKLLQQGNLNGYRKATELLSEIVEEVTMPEVVAVRKELGLERLTTSPLAVAFGAVDSSNS